jgi:serine/threonine-protein kinase
MSAIRTEEDFRDTKRRERPERDVPLWLSIPAAVLGGACVCFIFVWFFFTMNRPKQVSVPNVVGMDLAEANAALKTEKLEMRRAGSRPSETAEAGKVLETAPDAGSQVREGASISVITSTGSEYVAVPDLRGSTPDRAKTVLDSLGLDLNGHDLHQPDPQIGEGLIVKTVPESKAKVNRGAAVQLVISTGPAQVDTSDEPTNDQGNSDSGDSHSDSGNSYRYTLSIVLSDLQKPTEVRVDMTDDAGTRTVYDEERNQGDRFSVTATGEGNQAVFKVYYDNVPSKTIVKPAEGPAVQQ